MGQDVKNDSRFCQKPQGSERSSSPQGFKKSLNMQFRPNPILVAVSLTLILMTSGLAYYWMLPIPVEETPNAVIAIDGDADFSATAQLEGWPGDGSPDNPYVIDGLDIEVNSTLDIDSESHCILIRNTRASFTIRNCNLTGASCHMLSIVFAGITLVNVSGGLLVNNIFHNNEAGIYLADSLSNTVVNNTFHNTHTGILLADSLSNTLVNNTCNGGDIALENSHLNNGVNNTCNGGGIDLRRSNSNTMANNICYNNSKSGIYLYESESNTVANNNCFNNTEHGIHIFYSDSNTVSDNAFENNGIGIYLHRSGFNIVANNTCNDNDIGIYFFIETDSHNTMVDNTHVNNNVQDLVEEFYTREDDPEVPEVLPLFGFAGFTGFLVITLLAGLIVGKRVSKGE